MSLAPLPESGTDKGQYSLCCPGCLDPLDSPSSVLFVLFHLCWPFLTNRPLPFTGDKQLGEQIVEKAWNLL